MHRIALVLTGSSVAAMNDLHPHVGAFIRALRHLGYVEGRNLVLERRSAEGSLERALAIMGELDQRRFDVIVTAGNETAQAAKRVTSAVPVVMATSDDPVGAGIIASLARPGGNITGFVANPGAELEAKRLQLLKETLPAATRVALLAVSGLWDGAVGDSVRAAARLLGLTLLYREQSAARFADSFAEIARDRPDALFVPRHGSAFANRQLIADFAAEHRLPGMFPFREIVEAGGLMYYGTDIADLYARAAGHVDKILKGAKPADLPVEQPTKFELVINLKTAKALGIDMPATLLTRADELIE